MKLSLKNRYKNIFFWLGIGGVIFSAAGVDFQTMTTWGLLYEAMKNIAMNPVTLVSVIAAITGVIVDTSTPGFNDGD